MQKDGNEQWIQYNTRIIESGRDIITLYKLPGSIPNETEPYHYIMQFFLASKFKIKHMHISMTFIILYWFLII
jgi:hypothetical protein